MAETFQQIFDRIQNQSADLLRSNTLSWYLEQIRKVVTDGDIQSIINAQSTNWINQLDHAAKMINKTPEPPIRFPTNTIKSFSIGSEDNVNDGILGKMLLYRYDAKWKKILPYWDAYPLVFLMPTKFTDRALGINLHYLPPNERVKLFTALMTLLNNKKMDKTTRLKLTYMILKNNSKFIAYKPCLKSYLFSHIRTKLYVINPSQWGTALLLPLANFQKASDFTVWQDSINMIKKAKRKKKK